MTNEFIKRLKEKIEIRKGNRETQDERTSQRKTVYLKVNKVALHMNLAEKSFQEKYPSLEADKPPGDLTSSIVVFSP